MNALLTGIILYGLTTQEFYKIVPDNIEKTLSASFRRSLPEYLEHVDSEYVGQVVKYAEHFETNPYILESYISNPVQIVPKYYSALERTLQQLEQINPHQTEKFNDLKTRFKSTPIWQYKRDVAEITTFSQEKRAQIWDETFSNKNWYEFKNIMLEYMHENHKPIKNFRRVTVPTLDFLGTLSLFGGTPGLAVAGVLYTINTGWDVLMSQPKHFEQQVSTHLGQYDSMSPIERGRIFTNEYETMFFLEPQPAKLKEFIKSASSRIENILWALARIIIKIPVTLSENAYIGEATAAPVPQPIYEQSKKSQLRQRPLPQMKKPIQSTPHTKLSPPPTTSPRLKYTPPPAPALKLTPLPETINIPPLELLRR